MQVKKWISPDNYELIEYNEGDTAALEAAINGCLKYRLDKDYVGILVELLPAIKNQDFEAVPEVILGDVCRSIDKDSRLWYTRLYQKEPEAFSKAMESCLEAGKGKDGNKDDKKSESVQAEDDVDKEVVEANSMTSEDVHGGNEATRSILGSPSAASAGVCSNENQEDTDNSSDNKDDKKEEDKNHKGGKNQKASIDLESLLSALTPEEQNRAKIIKAALNKLCQMVHGKNQKGERHGWDARAIAKHFLCHQLNRIPDDRARKGIADQVVVAIDCSGSCWEFQREIKAALKAMSKECRIVILDCSNGFTEKRSRLVGMEDPYRNRERLEKAFCINSRIVMHKTITTPCVDDAAKIAANSKLFVVLADYDGYKSICETAIALDKDNPAKQLFFIDLEERYEDPVDHDWNCGYGTSDWPAKAMDHWWRLFERDTDEEDQY